MSAAEGPIDAKRGELLQEIVKATKITYTDSAIRGCLWLSEIEMLHQMADRAKSEPWIVIQQLKGGDINAIRQWASPRANQSNSNVVTPRKRANPSISDKESSPTRLPRPVASSSSATPPDTLNTRSEAAKKACARRDDDSCVIEKVAEPVDKCHIFPFALGREPESAAQIHLWGVLRNYWSASKIQAWKESVGGPELTERCANLLCLSASAHRLWGKARFALKPCQPSADKRTMDLRFYWLPVSRYSKIVPICEPPDLRLDLKSGHLGAKLWYGDDDRRIISGDKITISTHDPESHPLPSYELLQMQWILNQLVAISGAADVSDEELDDDDHGSLGGFYPLLEAQATSFRSHSRPSSRSPSRKPRLSENISPQRSMSKAREPTDAVLSDPNRTPLR